MGGTVLRAAGDAWAARAGGTSDVLWGAALAAVGDRLSDTGRASDDDLAAAVREGYVALVRLGKALPDDKTTLDALLPFTEALAKGGSGRCPWRSPCARSARPSRPGYIDAVLTDGTVMKLCRPRYGGSAHRWGFAIYRASHNDYEDSFFPTGLPVGTREDTLDTACGLYLVSTSAIPPHGPNPEELTGVTTETGKITGCTPTRRARGCLNPDQLR